MRRAFAVVVMLAAAVAGMPAKNEPDIETLVIPPYLEVVVFDVFRGARDATIDIFPPGATTALRPGTGGVESVRFGEVMATVVVPRPPAGEWTIRRSHRRARVRVLSQQFFPRGVLVAPKPGDALRQYDRVTIAYRITDTGGQPLQELAGYTLDADV
ncbi:MAG TPA: hypothetical protein VGR95_10720, partial [Thermoanaerobaculia bacterium]|nr:hypothetical protein [Thermoanaerobaculia bacterium]